MTQTYKVQVSMNQAHIVESGYVWKQGDFGFNIEIEVLDFDTTGATPQIIFRKSTGAVEATEISVAGNKFTYAIRGTELDTPGPCVCDLKLNDSTTKRVSTASFKYFVIPDTMDGLEQEASSYSDTIAQIVGGFDGDITDIHNALDLTVGTKILPVIATYQTVKVADSTVQMVDGHPKATYADGYCYRMAQCTEGDEFIVTGTGGGAGSRLYAFIDSSGNVLRRAAASASETNILITAPVGSAWVVVNTNMASTNYAYKTIEIPTRLNTLEGYIDSEAKASLKIAKAIYENKVDCGIKTSDGSDDTSRNKYWNTGIVALEKNHSVLSSNNNMNRIAFFDEQGAFISSTYGSAERTADIPSGARGVKVEYSIYDVAADNSEEALLFVDGKIIADLNFYPITFKSIEAKAQNDGLFAKADDTFLSNRVPYGFKGSTGKDDTTITNRWNTGLIYIGENKSLLTSNYIMSKAGFFDRNKAYLEAIYTQNNITIPNNAEYVKIEIYNSTVPYANHDNLQFFVDGKIIANIDKENIPLRQLEERIDAGHIEGLNLSGTYTAPFSIYFYDVKKVNYLIKCRAKYTGETAPTLTIYSGFYRSAEYTVGDSQFEMQEWRFPGPINDGTVSLSFSIPTGTTLTIDYLAGQTDTGRKINSGGLRFNSHLGFISMAPENTLPAFCLSGEIGYEACIVVPKATQDGVLVCIHDDTINRTARDANGDRPTETMNVADMTYEELLNWDFGAWHSPYYANTKIPTVEEFFKVCSKYRMKPMFSTHPGLTSNQWQTVKALLIKYGLLKDFHVKAFNINILKDAYDVLGMDIDGYTGEYTDNIDYVTISKMDDFVTSKNIDRSKVRLVLEADISSLTQNDADAIIAAGYQLGGFTLTKNIQGSAVKNFINMGVTEFTDDVYCVFGLNW